MKSDFFMGALTGLSLSALTAGWLFVILVGETGAVAGQCSPVYFATTNDGRLMPLAPRSQPTLTDAALTSWAARTTSDVLSFGFNDRETRMHKNAASFDAAGWKAFLAALSMRGWDEKSDHLRPYYVTTVAAPPAIHRQGIKDGVYTWVLDIPLVTTVKTPDNEAGKNMAYNATIVVQRAQDLNKYEGIEIAGFSLAEQTQR